MIFSLEAHTGAPRAFRAVIPLATARDGEPLHLFGWRILGKRVSSLYFSRLFKSSLCSQFRKKSSVFVLFLLLFVVVD